MFYCVAYDIHSDRTRRLMAKWCIQAGLRRVQRSVFTGDVPDNQLKTLQEQAATVITATDRFCLFPLDKNTLKSLLLMGDNAAKMCFEPQPLVRSF